MLPSSNIVEKWIFQSADIGIKSVTKAALPVRDLGTLNRVEMSGTLDPALSARIKGEPGVVDLEAEIITRTQQRPLFGLMTLGGLIQCGWCGPTVPLATCGHFGSVLIANL